MEGTIFHHGRNHKDKYKYHFTSDKSNLAHLSIGKCIPIDDRLENCAKFEDGICVKCDDNFGIYKHFYGENMDQIEYRCKSIKDVFRCNNVVQHLYFKENEESEEDQEANQEANQEDNQEDNQETTTETTTETKKEEKLDYILIEEDDLFMGIYGKLYENIRCISCERKSLNRGIYFDVQQLGETSFC